MILELTDEEIMDFLMTSDLYENYRPDDYKYLILKFRSFYKILHGKHQLYKINNEVLIKNLQSTLDNLTKELQSQKNQSEHLKNEIIELQKPRKLTFKERFFGKTKN